MKYKTSIVFLNSKLNKYSINALLGAIEGDISLKNLKVFLLERNEDYLKKIGQILKDFKKTIFCISFATPQIFEIYEIVQLIKKKFGEKIILIAGGPHPTGEPEKTLNMGFDFVFGGEGEETFLDFLKVVEKDFEVKNIKGIYLKKDGKIFYTGKGETVNLDKFIPFSIRFNRYNPIEITRGCIHKCSFCQTPQIFGNKLRHRSIEKISKLVEIMKKMNLKDIRFISPNAFSYGSEDGIKINLKAIEELLREIKKILKDEGRIFFGTFPSEVRPEFVKGDVLNIIKKYVSNKNLIIGAQVGSDNILKKCKRGHDVSEIFEAVEISKKFGFTPHLDFIFGFPFEKEEDINETIEVIDKLIKKGVKINAHTFMPLPGTKFKNLKFKGINEKIKNKLEKLISRGVVYGNWKEQENISKKIYENYKMKGEY